jgi:alpha-beta hydrolase superfamily lysophospholipase
MTLAPGPLEPTRTLTIPRPDAALHAAWYAPPRPRGLVVISHGYAEHGGRYREVAHVLTRAGAAVLTYDCRGHGRSTGPRGHVDRFESFLDDLQAAIGWARGECATVGLTHPRLLLLGHSHGALIVLRALADRSRHLEATAAVLSSPYLALRMKVSPAKRVAGQVAARFYPPLSVPNGIRIEDLTSDETKRAERRADPLCHDVATAGWHAAATEAQVFVTEHAPAIRVPTLWLVGGDDAIADPAHSRLVADRMRSAPVEYHELAGLRHEVFNERTRGDVFAHLTRFVGHHLTS